MQKEYSAGYKVNDGELQAATDWVGAETAVSGDMTEGMGNFDQFEQNFQKFGVRSRFDENQYV